MSRDAARRATPPRVAALLAQARFGTAAHDERPRLVSRGAKARSSSGIQTAVWTWNRVNSRVRPREHPRGLVLVEEREAHEQSKHGAAMVAAGKRVLLVRNTSVLPETGSLNRMRRKCSG